MERYTLQKIQNIFEQAVFQKANYWCSIQSNPLVCLKHNFKTNIAPYSNQLSINASLDFPDLLTNEQIKKASHRANLDIIIKHKTNPLPMVFRFHVIPKKVQVTAQSTLTIEVSGFLQEIFCYNQMLNQYIYPEDGNPDTNKQSYF